MSANFSIIPQPPFPFCELLARFLLVALIPSCVKWCLNAGVTVTTTWLSDRDRLARPLKPWQRLELFRWSHLEDIKRVFLKPRGNCCKHACACSLFSLFYFSPPPFRLLVNLLGSPRLSSSPLFFSASLSPPLISVHLSPPPSHKPLIHPSMSPCLPRLHLSVHLRRRSSSSAHPVFIFTCAG